MSDRSYCTVTVRPEDVPVVEEVFGPPDEVGGDEDVDVLCYHDMCGGGYEEEEALQKRGITYIHTYESCPGAYEAGVSAHDAETGEYMHRMADSDGNPAFETTNGLIDEAKLEEFRRALAIYRQVLLKLGLVKEN